MKKLLNNPIFVIILAVSALFYLFWNVVRPMMGWNRSTSHKSKQAVTEIQEQDRIENNSQNRGGNPQLEYDSTQVNTLHNEWVFSYSRDPFRNHKRYKRPRQIDLRPQPISKRTRLKRTRSKSPKKSRPEEVQAISIGPNNCIALINGELVDVTSIHSVIQDTIQLEIDNSTKTFTFQPKANP